MRAATVCFYGNCANHRMWRSPTLTRWQPGQLKTCPYLTAPSQRLLFFCLRSGNKGSELLYQGPNLFFTFGSWSTLCNHKQLSRAHARPQTFVEVKGEAAFKAPPPCVARPLLLRQTRSAPKHLQPPEEASPEAFWGAHTSALLLIQTFTTINYN